MKIIVVDNFDRETRSDDLVAENLNAFYADHIVVFLNDKFGGDESIFFRIVEDDYQLYTWKP